MIATVFDKLFSIEFMAKVEKKVHHLPVTAINIANGVSFPNGENGTHRLMGENIFERESMNK